jgi:hypothetical protein
MKMLKYELMMLMHMQCKCNYARLTPGVLQLAPRVSSIYQKQPRAFNLPLLVIDDNPFTKIRIEIILNPCCLPKHIYHLQKDMDRFHEPK